MYLATYLAMYLPMHSSVPTMYLPTEYSTEYSGLHPLFYPYTPHTILRTRTYGPPKQTPTRHNRANQGTRWRGSVTATLLYADSATNNQQRKHTE